MSKPNRITDLTEKIKKTEPKKKNPIKPITKLLKTIRFGSESVLYGQNRLTQTEPVRFGLKY